MLMHRIIRRVARVGVVAGIGAAVAMSAIGPASAQVEYKIPGLLDFSGPYADLTKQLIARDAVIKWWDDHEGKKLGVKLTVKNYDTRYDGSVVAGLWPGIMTEMKPIVGMGLGGADESALEQRLPNDRVPMIYATPAYGFGWRPDQWVFHPRAPYAAEYAAGLMWFAAQHPDKKPIKVAFLSTQSSPAFVDIVKGLTKYIDDVLEPKGIAKVVATEWVAIQPVDVSAPMKKIVDAKADILFGTVNTTIAAAALRAEQLYGVTIPTMASPWHTIWPLARAMKSYKPWEGHLVVTGIAPMTEKSGPAWEFYQTLSKNYGLPPDWNPLSLLGISQGLLTVRAVEHAAKKVGGDKLTGQAVYDALLGGEFTEKELMGILPTIQYSKTAPFPTKGSEVHILTVKDGKYQLATPNWIPVPKDLTKWDS